MRFEPNFPFRFLSPMNNLSLSVFWWILGAKRSLRPRQMFLETNSPRNMNPPNRDTYSKPIIRRLCRGGGGASRYRSQLNLRGIGMVVFHFPVMPTMACPCTLSRMYFEIWFWGTRGVVNIV